MSYFIRWSLLTILLSPLAVHEASAQTCSGGKTLSSDGSGGYVCVDQNCVNAIYQQYPNDMNAIGQLMGTCNSPAEYPSSAPTTTSTPTPPVKEPEPRRKYFFNGAMSLKFMQFYFDEDYYRQTYPDVGPMIASGEVANGFEHYLLIGAFEKRSPRADFNEQAYLDTYPNVKEYVKDKLFLSGYEHWAAYGKIRGAILKPATPPSYRCEMSVPNCPNHSDLSKTPFNDTWDGAGSNMNRCMKRAQEYFSWCDTRIPVTAKFYINQSAVASETAGESTCEITIPSCQNQTVVLGKGFIDGVPEAQNNKNRCLSRAQEYSDWCGNSPAVTAKYYVNGSVTASITTAPPQCMITIKSCPNFPQVGGTFPDGFSNWWGDTNRCAARAREYADWCATMDVVNSTSTKNGQTVQSTNYQRNALLNPLIFNWLEYIYLNPDLIWMNQQQAEDHWVNYGIYEGRIGSNQFSVKLYLSTYGDLSAAFGSTGYKTALEHYLNYGYKEGRRAQPSSVPAFMIPIIDLLLGD